ncbi:MAG: hypothetical protein ACI4R9_02745 [Kiritimatiellia bacterium]
MLWKKRKPVVAVIGTDGAGKSTLLDAVVPLLEKKMSGKVRVCHLRPYLFPPMERFRGIKRKHGYVCANPHGAKPSGFVCSLLRLTYLVGDYVFGFWFRVRPILRRKDVSCWVFDRYAYDILIDPLRFRVRLPRWIVRLYLMIVPHPDIILCLGGDCEKIFARKPETSLDEVKRQMKELYNLSKSSPNMCFINTTVSIEDTMSAAIDALEPLWSER